MIFSLFKFNGHLTICSIKQLASASCNCSNRVSKWAIFFLFNLLHPFSLILLCFLFFVYLLLNIFFGFSCNFLHKNAFSLNFLLLVAFTLFSWKFLTAFLLSNSNFRLQCNLIVNLFWLTSVFRPCIGNGYGVSSQ